MRKVAIVQEYLPAYRVALFEHLQERLAICDIDLTLVYSPDDSIKAKRLGQSVLPWATHVPKTSPLRLAGLTYQHFFRDARRYDLVIVEQATRHLLNYALLAARKHRRQKVAFWGHGYDHQAKRTGVHAFAKRQMAATPDWWFAYTQGVTDYLLSIGYDTHRITTLQNTIDAAQLRRNLDHIRGRNPAGVPNSNHALYLGGLYRHKRIEFLIESCDLIHELLPDFTVTFAGDGELSQLVERAAESRPWFRMAGALSGMQKAEELVRARAILCPGIVGLVAVDALVAEVPIITISSDRHSPEFEYLGPADVFVAPKDCSVRQFSELTVLMLQRLTSSSGRQTNESKNLRSFDIERMAQDFADGIIRALAT